MSGYDIVRFFFLTKLITIVETLLLSSFSNKARRNEGAMHGREKTPAKHTSHSKHMKRVHENVVLSLEYQHKVEGTGDPQRHAVRKRALSKWIYQEDCSSRCDGGRICNTDPRPHAKSIRQFPFASHIAKDANEEVEDNELVRTAVVEPFVK